MCFDLCVSVDKSEDDVERESQLLECRLTLTEERNAVLVPSAGSGIPGAPVERCVCVFCFSDNLCSVFRKKPTWLFRRILLYQGLLYFCLSIV